MIDIKDLYCRYGDLVFGRALQLLNDEDKAKDALQEVFIRLMNYKKKIITGKEFSFIYKVTTNTCLNIIRSHKRKNEVDGNSFISFPSPEDLEKNISVKDYLNYLFKDEQESTRLIATLYYVDNLTMEEVSEIVDLSISGVKKRLSRFRDKIEVFKKEAKG